jgi:hypothetical protein
MKKTISCSIMKLGVLFFVTLFFQTALVSVSKASEKTPFYKSWLIERGYTHPGLGGKSKSSAIKKMAQPKAMASATTAKTKRGRFWHSWLQERSYAHPGITSSAATSIPAKNISSVAPGSGGKKTTAKYKSRPEFNVCKFVCLSTCKSCKTSSSNYLMSRE